MGLSIPTAMKQEEDRAQWKRFVSESVQNIKKGTTFNNDYYEEKENRTLKVYFNLIQLLFC